MFRLVHSVIKSAVGEAAKPFKDEAQTALFKGPVRTAQ
jgi:hypothetical protein